MTPQDTELKDRLKKSGGWLLQKRPDPIHDDATAFYNENSKMLKRPIILNKKHVALEREEWTDKRWLGDKTAFIAELSQKAGLRNEKIQKSKRPTSADESEVVIQTEE